MGGRHLDAGAREAKGRLDEPLPREDARATPELVEARGDPRDRAGPRPDEVVDELVAERNGHLLDHRSPPWAAQPWDGDEEVEELRAAARTVEPERVAAAGDARHDGLGDARGEDGGDRGIGRGAAIREDFEAGLGRRRMTRCYAGGHGHLC